MFLVHQKNFLLSNLCTCRNRKSLLQWHFITSNSKATQRLKLQVLEKLLLWKVLESTKEFNLRVTLKRYLQRAELPPLTALPRSSGAIRCGSLVLFYLKCRGLFAKERFGEPCCHCKLLFIFIAAECAVKRNICINKCNYVTPKSAAAHVSATSARSEWQKWFRRFPARADRVGRHSPTSICAESNKQSSRRPPDQSGQMRSRSARICQPGGLPPHQFQRRNSLEAARSGPQPNWSSPSRRQSYEAMPFTCWHWPHPRYPLAKSHTGKNIGH